MKSTTLIVTIGIAIFMAFTLFMMNMNYNNKYSTFVAEAKARQDVSKVTFDNTWKVIAGQAKVADKERESFKAAFVEIMNARTQNDDGLLMKWSQEAQVPITADLYKTLQQTIESQRNTFTTAQKELIDIKREADTMRTTAPASYFIGGREEIKIQLVLSAKTDAAFGSGQDNDVDPFSGK
jgi:hypothetical protein